MNKLFKLISLFAVVAMLAVTLCSCDMIDDKREHHAIWIESNESFELGGKVYRRVSDKQGMNIAALSDARVTTKNVPVLLAERYGSHISVNGEKGVATYGLMIYATEDRADYAKRIIDNGNASLVTYGTNQYVYNDDGSIEARHFLVSSEQRNIITSAINSVKQNPDGLTKNVVADYSITIYRYDSMGVFKDSLPAVNICRSGNAVYVKVPSIDGYYKLSVSAAKQIDEFVNQMKIAGVRIG